MKKLTLSVLLALLALGVFTGVAAAQTIGTGAGSGILHDYLVAALADALNLTTADVDARLTAGETMYQIALEEGIAPTDIPTLLVEVRTNAVNAAVADGVLTQAQADRNLRHGLHGNGSGMMRGGTGTGTGSCGGTGVPVGSAAHRGGRWLQVNP
jgi:hypothetical protein